MKNESIFPEILLSEDNPDIRIENKSECFYCHSSPVPHEVVFCPVCRFPQNGLMIEQQTFILEARDKAARHLQLEYTIGWSQTVLLFSGITGLVIAVASFLGPTAAKMMREGALHSLWYIILAVVPNLAIWAWSKKRPFESILMALVLMVCGAAVQFMTTEFTTLGLSVALLFIVMYSNGLYSFREALKIERELVFKPQKIG